MELFTGRIGLGFVRSPARISRTLAHLPSPFLGCQRGLSFQKTPKLGFTFFEIQSRHSFDKYICKTEICGHNLRVSHSFVQRRLFSDKLSQDCHGSQAAVQKLNIFQKMKQMTKDYWHVLVPVHVVTSIGWMLIFYTAAKNSVDVIWIMEQLHFSERYIEALRGSSAGFWAVAYALYKIFTPLRYMVTVGGTTLSIKYLRRLGYVKPKPSAAQKLQVEHKSSIGKLGCKDGQRQADPPKT